jgi:formylglycine-generating enzyme required for sulfatase activity
MGRREFFSCFFIFSLFFFLLSGVYAQQDAAPDGFVWIQGGTFMMGSPAKEPEREDNEIQHRVTLSSFYMGKYEVTQKEYQEIMETNLRGFKGDNLPVEMVSWYNAVEYCNKRSEKEGLSPAYNIDKENIDQYNSSSLDRFKWTVTWNRNANGYRLPTEAEWEYACRAGTKTPFNTGNNLTTSQANYNGKWSYNNNAEGENRQKTTPVGSFAPNAWGLYDMHGNVWEFCWDRYGRYASEPQIDPTGTGSKYDYERVSRGGGWHGTAGGARSAARFCENPSHTWEFIGFRVVRQLTSNN